MGQEKIYLTYFCWAKKMNQHTAFDCFFHFSAKNKPKKKKAIFYNFLLSNIAIYDTEFERQHPLSINIIPTLFATIPSLDVRALPHSVHVTSLARLWL